jgi:hypothetical protein
MGRDMETPGDEKTPSIQKTVAEAMHELSVIARVTIEEVMKTTLSKRVSELYPNLSGTVMVDNPPALLQQHVDGETTILHPFDGDRGIRFYPHAETETEIDLDALLESVAIMVGQTLNYMGRNRFCLYRRDIRVSYDAVTKRADIRLFVTMFAWVV